MADIPLRTYLEQIDGLIDSKRIDEAIAHCRHVLSFYPKHIGTYRLLGKALLEKGRHGDAADIFQRVLSAVPDDFVSHVGMSIVREDEANLESALWHMERAFEANPANTAIQEELRRLYGRRDGVVPPKARLTRGALARMYSRGALYPQAEAEIKAALRDDPERVDLATVLAQVYWHSEQRAEAAETCSSIIQKLPYSQEANRILAGILQSQGRANDAVPYRQRLEALDPYEAFVDPSTNGHGVSKVKPDVIRVPGLEYAPDMAESASGSPDWVTSLGEDFEVPAEQPTIDMSPDWFTPAAAEESPFAADLPAAGELPAWLQDIQPAGAEEAGPAPEAEAAGAEPDWLSEVGLPESQEAVATPTEDMPDWLKAATGPLTSAQVPDWMKTDEPATPAAALPVSDEETPDWIRDAAPAASEDQDSLDWMKAAAATPAVVSGPAVVPEDLPIEEAKAAEPAEDETPDWLKGFTPTPVTAAPAAVEMPDWLKAVTGPFPGAEAQPWEQAEKAEAAAAPLEEAEAQEPMVSEAAEPTPADEIPEWMRPAAPAAAAPSVADDLPEWMKGAAEPTPVDELPEWMRPAAPAAEAPQVAAEPPEWMKGAAEPTPEDEIPEWMRSAAPAAAPAAESAPVAADLPEWMKGAAEPTPVDELPEWMRPAAAATELLEPSDEAPAEVESALAPAAEENIPEWMKPAAAEPAAEAPELAASPTAETEIPDWLSQMEAEADAYEAQVAPPTPPAAELATAAPEVGLPDFLQPASPEAIARANEPTHLADEAGEDWLAEVMTASTAEVAEEEPPAEPGEVPDWIKAMAPPTPEPTEARAMAQDEAEERDLASMDAEEAMRWLEGLALQHGGKAEEMVASPPADAAGREAEAETELLAEPEAEAPLPAAPEEAPQAPPAVSEAETAAPDLASMDADEAMRWLEGLALEHGGKPDEMVSAPVEAKAETPEWLRAPAEPEEEAPAADVPAWAQADEPGATDTITSWLSGKDVPEWLRRPGEEAALPPADWLRTPIEEEATAEAEVTPAESAPSAPLEMGEAEAPDLASMDADEAMRWLEGLALQHGGRPEEMVTPAEEPTTVTPAWISAQQVEAVEAEPATVDEAAAPAEETISAEAMLGEEPQPPGEPAEAPSFAAPVAPEAPAAEEWPSLAPPPAMPAAEAEGEDEALSWLESLALQHGAQPEELITPAEERAVQPPAWVTAEPSEVAAEAAPEAEAAPAAAELAPAEPAKETVEPVAADEDDRLTRLAGRLAATKRAKEAEIEARFAARRAEEEAARRAIEQSMEDKKAQLEASRAGTGRLGPGRTGTGPFSTKPGTGQLAAKTGTGPLPAKPGTGPLAAGPAAQVEAPPPAPVAEQPVSAAPTTTPAPAPPELAAAPPAAEVAPPAPKPAARPKALPRRRGKKSPYANQPPDEVFALGQQHLATGDDENAAEALSYLVATGKLVSDIVRELEVQTARRPGVLPLLQVLGDAYMKDNQLQKALDAYRMALGQL